MEGFAACESFSVRVRETDGVEKIGGGGGTSKNSAGWGVKLVDAKFTLVPPPLPPSTGKGGRRESGRSGSGSFAPENGGSDEAEEEVWDRVKGRFINLEGLEYAEEHDDLTVGFEGEDGEFACYSLCSCICYTFSALLRKFCRF
jgi:hypothetical protein